MDEEFQANAVIIDLLLRAFAELEMQYNALTADVPTLKDAQYYLKSLMKTINVHPELSYEWECFLDNNGLPPCPVVSESSLVKELSDYQNHYHDSRILRDRINIITASLLDLVIENDPVYAQRNLIDELKIHNQSFKEIIERISKQTKDDPGRYYMNLQHHIRDTPSAMDAWKTFLMMIKLTVENPIRGITHDYTT